jgi:predicted RNase H-like HicB family nuclease
MTLTIELEQETDGRWIAEIPQLPGVLAYGDTQDKAAQQARALAFRVLEPSSTLLKQLPRQTRLPNN